MMPDLPTVFATAFVTFVIVYWLASRGCNGHHEEWEYSDEFRVVDYSDKSVWVREEFNRGSGGSHFIDQKKEKVCKDCGAVSATRWDTKALISHDPIRVVDKLDS